MELFAYSTIAYFVGLLFSRAIYKARLKNLVEAQRAVMDTVIDQVDEPASLIPYCSDSLVRGVYASAAQSDPRFKVAEREMSRRGLTLPPPGPPFRFPDHERPM